MDIVLVAAHTEARATARWLVQARDRRVHLLTLGEPALRVRSAAWDPVAELGGLAARTARTDDINDGATLRWIAERRPDAVVVLGWSQILREAALAAAPWVVGAHASPLPRGRGGSPLNWAIINGERQWGNTLMRLSPRLDGGSMLGQSLFELDGRETIEGAYAKVEASNLALVSGWMSDLRAGTVVERPQPAPAEAPFRRRTSADGVIDWRQPAERVDALVRAVTRPYPGARTVLCGRTVLVWRAVPCAGPEGAAPGTVLRAAGPTDGPVVQCGSGCLQVGEAVYEDGQAVADWQEGTVLGGE